MIERDDIGGGGRGDVGYGEGSQEGPDSCGICSARVCHFAFQKVVYGFLEDHSLFSINGHCFSYFFPTASGTCSAWDFTGRLLFLKVLSRSCTEGVLPAGGRLS